MGTHTHTYALLKLSKTAYEEIRLKLELAGYDFQFHPNDESPENPVIDMHGIAVAPEVESVPTQEDSGENSHVGHYPRS